jgi:hypothetical protein
MRPKQLLAFVVIKILLRIGWMLAFAVECLLHFELRDEARPLVAINRGICGAAEGLVEWGALK